MNCNGEQKLSKCFMSFTGLIAFFNFSFSLKYLRFCLDVSMYHKLFTNDLEHDCDILVLSIKIKKGFH